MQKVILALSLVLAVCTSITAQPVYFSVKFPDDKTVIGCGATADTSDQPIITYYASCNFNVGISVKDQVFNLNATGGCKKIFRTWKLVYWCDYDPNWPGPTYVPNPPNTDIGPTINGDIYNHGYLEYTQIIKIRDEDAPVYLNCPTGPVLFCDYTNNDPAQYGNKCEGPVDLSIKVTDVCSKADINMSYLLFLDLDGNGSMETVRSSSMPNAWPIETTIVDDTLCASIKLPAGVGLPYGTHKVEWIAADGCGNQSICKYEFIVKDCKAPTVVCINGLSVNIMPTGMITFWASDFVLYANDNCTPSNLLKIAIRKSGSGTGFPAGNTNVTFDCTELGQQFVDVWAEDECGNGGYCQTYVIVQDHMGTCPPSGPVTGNVATDGQAAVKGAKILLKNNLIPAAPQFNTKTDLQGNYSFPGPPGTCNYSIIPTLDTLPANGVNTMDVMLADWHINGQQLLTTPYRIIAADANHDGQLNQSDLDAMSDLILGLATSFPNNTSWRFVPSAFGFANPQNPLAGAFPELISTICPMPSGLNQHFVAIKTGDTDSSADPIHNLAGAIDDRSAEDKTVTFRMSNQRFEAGDDITATLISPELSSMLGFQFTLHADEELLELQSVEPVMGAKMASYPDQNNVALSWYSKSGEASGIRPVITLHFKALQAGTLKKALEFRSTVTKAEAYDQERAPMSVALEFTPGKIKANYNNSALSVSPNPSAGPINAQFFMAEAGQANLSLTNLSGGTVATHQAYFDAGWQQVEMSVSSSAVSGVYALRLQTASGNEVQRVMLQRK